MSNQPNQDKDEVFSCGLELADTVLTSNLPQGSLAFIQKLNDDPTKNISDSSLPFNLVYNAYDDDQNKCEIIAFDCEVGGASPAFEQKPPGFTFLIQTKDHQFSINEEALKLFRSFFHHEARDLFQRLKNPSKPLIITGHSLGGSVASLFCLWLLQNIHHSNLNIPICITFGSPLVGDDGFSKAIHNRSGWFPRFLHVVSDGDLIPRAFLSTTTIDNNCSYKPFGTFLMCSPFGSACFYHPDLVLRLLTATGGSQMPNLMDYRKLLDDLTDRMNFSDGASQLNEFRDGPLQAGIILQLVAIGDSRMQEDNKEDNLIKDLKEQIKKSYDEHKRRISNADKKLNDMKTNMAQLEWYKKVCSTKLPSSTELPIGYYDCFRRRQQLQRDMNVITFKISLNKYWEEVVEEAERKPRKQLVAPLVGRLLGAGTNYRRMVEPLDIAYYYKQGNRNYRNEGRPKHYKLLQEWQEKEEKAAGHERKSNSRDRAASLTEDSCFWADVEEIMILTNSLNNGEAIGETKESLIENLKIFEIEVMGLIDNKAVSPEIFLKESTFMKWWNEYENIPERTQRSSLANFMEKKLYQKYI